MRSGPGGSTPPRPQDPAQTHGQDSHAAAGGQPDILLISTGAPPGNDRALVEAHVRARRDLRAGDIAMLRILHDDWCDHWSGRPCNCEPEVESGPQFRRSRAG